VDSAQIALFDFQHAMTQNDTIHRNEIVSKMKTSPRDKGEIRPFRWWKAKRGYVIRGGRIVPLGPEMVPYEVRPGSKRGNERLRPQVWQALDALDMAMSDNADVIAFANEFGLLGALAYGDAQKNKPVASGMPLSAFWMALNHLRIYVASAHDNVESETSKLTEVFNRLAPKDWQLRMERRGNSGRITYHFEPASLLAWLWLYFADEKSVERRTCSNPACGQAFQVIHRKSIFCSNKCRSEFHNAQRPVSRRYSKRVQQDIKRR
jgi:hypothetical protein